MNKKDPWNSKTAIIVGIMALLLLFSSFYIMNQPPVQTEKAPPVTKGVISITIVRPPEPRISPTGMVAVEILRDSEVK